MPVDVDYGAPMIWLSYCYELGLYHLHAEAPDSKDDPNDAKYDREEMISAIEALTRAGESAQAELLARLAAVARQYGHHVVVYYSTGKVRICRPLPPHEEERAEREARREEVAKWFAENGDRLIEAPAMRHAEMISPER
jgi:hypothetical protein